MNVSIGSNRDRRARRPGRQASAVVLAGNIWKLFNLFDSLLTVFTCKRGVMTDDDLCATFLPGIGSSFAGLMTKIGMLAGNRVLK
jgi:hypothetical protein